RLLQPTRAVRQSPAPRRAVLAWLLTLFAVAGAAAQVSTRAAPDDGLSPIRWVRVGADNEVTALKRWYAGVGPPFVEPRQSSDDAAPEVPVIVSWNTHVGAGDVEKLVADLRSGTLTGRPVRSFVLLL